MMQKTILPTNQPLAEAEIISRARNDHIAGIDDVRGYLDEYIRYFSIGEATPAEILTLHRALPQHKGYREAVLDMGLNENPPLVVGGAASVSVKDNQGHVVTEEALKRAFTDYISDKTYRNVMLFHSDIQIGLSLPFYICKNGVIVKSGVKDGTLYLVSEISDKPHTENVKAMIKKGGLRSYSIGGTVELNDPNAVRVVSEPNGRVTKLICNMRIAEVSIAMKGVNDHTQFKILKAANDAERAARTGARLDKLLEAGRDYSPYRY